MVEQINDRMINLRQQQQVCANQINELKKEQSKRYAFYIVIFIANNKNKGMPRRMILKRELNNVRKERRPCRSLFKKRETKLPATASNYIFLILLFISPFLSFY